MRGALYLESTLKGLRANSAAALRRWASISVRWYGQVRTAAVCYRRNLSPLIMGCGRWKGLRGYRAVGPLPTPDIEGRLALAVWVARAGSTEPVQATGGWLMLAEEVGGEVLYITDGAQYTESWGWT